MGGWTSRKPCDFACAQTAVGANRSEDPTMKYKITGSKYGEHAEFDSLTEAQEAYHAKGGRFEDTTFMRTPDGQIVDETGDVVGEVKE